MSRDKLISLIFAAMVLLGCSVTSFAATTVEEQLSSFVQQMYGNTEIQVSFNIPPQIRDKARVKNISFSKIPDGFGDGVCLVTAETRNGSEIAVYVPFKVQVRRTLYVLKNNMKKGDILRPADLTAKQTFFSGGRNFYPLSVDDVVGKSMKKDTVAGEIITLQVLEEQIAVARGEVVNMTVESSKLIVQAKGTAMEKGKMGDLIRVKSVSGKEVIGRVTGNNSITVQF
jgi:flagellar basal body P-ring formation protein FlgA